MRFVLVGILLIAAAIRLPLLDTVPAAMFSDELSTGYDAYSLLQTGRDIYGESWPILTRSFNTYPEASYRYLTMPSVALLGLTSTAVRLPAALIGILTVYVLFLLGREVYGPVIGLGAAAALALSPWHIQFSRIGFRSILLPLLVAVGLLFWMRFLRGKRPHDLMIGALSIALSLYSYISARVFVPFLILALVVVYFQDIRQAGRVVWGAVGVGLVAVGILLPIWISETGMVRLTQTGLVDPTEMIANYLSYFSPDFLFWSGDPELRHSPSAFGQLHVFEAVFVVAGLITIWKRRSRFDSLLLAWLLLYPIPAFLISPDHALRSVAGIGVFAILSGIGIGKLWSFGSGQRQWVMRVAIVIVLIGSGAAHASHYFGRYAAESATSWQYGVKEAFDYALDSDYRCVIVSNNGYLYPPYIFPLFYDAFPPDIYQQLPMEDRVRQWMHRPKPLGTMYVKRVSDIRLNRGRCLIILRPDEVPILGANGYEPIPMKTISSPTGEPVLELVELNK